MSRNRGRNTKPEVTLRKACWALGIRYVLDSRLPGRPDFVLPRCKVAVFVDGCFWHGCPEHYHAPATRADFWAKKIEATRQRDVSVARELETAGWKVVRIWEHSVKSDLLTVVGQVMEHVGPSQFAATGKLKT